MSFEREDSVEPKGRYVVRNIPKYRIIEFLNRLNISRYCVKFDKNQIISFLSECHDDSLHFFDFIFIEGKKSNEVQSVQISGRSIRPVFRNNCKIRSDCNRLEVGRKGKLSGTRDTLAGITDFNGYTKEQIITNAINEYKKVYFDENGIDFQKEVFPTDTWFKFVTDRKPTIFIYLIQIGVDEDDQTQKRQIEEFRRQMNGIPAVGIAMGIPRNDSAERHHTRRYKANKVYNWFDRDEIIEEAEGDVE